MVTTEASWVKDIVDSLKKHFPLMGRRERPLFKTGEVAAGDVLVKDVDLLARWLESARQLMAIETESAGVQRACWNRGGHGVDPWN
jgi:nucleoside phosphorylase